MQSSAQEVSVKKPITILIQNPHELFPVGAKVMYDQWQESKYKEIHYIAIP
jgi:hypothetical protein